jgi:hypothetical protein
VNFSRITCLLTVPVGIHPQLLVCSIQLFLQDQHLIRIWTEESGHCAYHVFDLCNGQSQILMTTSCGFLLGFFFTHGIHFQELFEWKVASCLGRPFSVCCG